MLHLSAIYLPIYGMNNQIGLFSRVHPNTHSNTIVVRNGFAWAVRIATLSNTRIHMGITTLHSEINANRFRYFSRPFLVGWIEWILGIRQFGDHP